MGKKVNKKVLENLAKSGTLYCQKHKYLISKKELNQKRCYIGLGESKYCKYLAMITKIK